MINLVLFGPPGSGKGTQALLLVEKYDLMHISTGDMFRYHLKNNTQLGQLAQSYIDKGALVPDEVTINMLKVKVLENPNANGFIFDGFPRTVAQAEALDKLLLETETSILQLVELKVAEDEIVKRILKRGETSGRADDVDVATIKKRFQVYLDNTRPVADYYAAQGKASAVEGLGTIEAIHESICSCIDGLLVEED